MDTNKLIERIKNILLTPATEWPVVAGESTSVVDLYKNYIVILAALPAVFGFIKGSLIGIDVPLIGTMRVGVVAGLTGMIVSYLLGLAQVYLIALIVDALAPTFNGQKNLLQALKLAAYAFTAAWIASIAQIVPWIGGLLALAGGCYSIYLFYLGLPELMRAPKDRAVGYTVVSIIATIVLSVIVAFFVGSITGTTSPRHVDSSDIQFDKNSPIGKLDTWTKKMEQATQQVESAQKSGDSAAQGEAVGQLLGAALGGGKVEALAPDKLKPFVPDTLGGLPRKSISVERNSAMGMQISEAQATFGDGSGQNLRLEITDTGSAKGLMALAGWASMQEEKETDSGYSKTYHDGDQITHEEWDKSGHGEYAAVIAERFTVKVTGDVKDPATLKSAFGEVNVAGLEALKDEGVNDD